MPVKKWGHGTLVQAASPSWRFSRTRATPATSPLLTFVFQRVQVRSNVLTFEISYKKVFMSMSGASERIASKRRRWGCFWTFKVCFLEYMQICIDIIVNSVVRNRLLLKITGGKKVLFILLSRMAHLTGDNIYRVALIVPTCVLFHQFSCISV